MTKPTAPPAPAGPLLLELADTEDRYAIDEGGFSAETRATIHEHARRVRLVGRALGGVDAKRLAWVRRLLASAVDYRPPGMRGMPTNVTVSRQVATNALRMLDALQAAAMAGEPVPSWRSPAAKKASAKTPGTTLRIKR